MLGKSYENYKKFQLKGSKKSTFNTNNSSNNKQLEQKDIINKWN